MKNNSVESLGPCQLCWRSSIVFKLAELYCFWLVHLSVVTLTVIFNRISSKFHIWIASTNLSFKFEYGLCLTNDKQDGRQNGRRLCVHCHGHTNSVIFYQISSKGALAWYGKLTWESVHARILKILCYLIVWGIT